MTTSFCNLRPGSGLEKQNKKLLRQRYQAIKDAWDCGDCAFVQSQWITRNFSHQKAKNGIQENVDIRVSSSVLKL